MLELGNMLLQNNPPKTSFYIQHNSQQLFLLAEEPKYQQYYLHIIVEFQLMSFYFFLMLLQIVLLRILQSYIFLNKCRSIAQSIRIKNKIERFPYSLSLSILFQTKIASYLLASSVSKNKVIFMIIFRRFLSGCRLLFSCLSLGHRSINYIQIQVSQKKADQSKKYNFIKILQTSKIIFIKNRQYHSRVWKIKGQKELRETKLKFLSFVNKSDVRSHQARFSKESLLGISDEITGDSPGIKNSMLEVQMMPTMSSLPPEWVDKYQQCLNLIRKIDSIKKRMLTEQNRRLSSVKISDEKQAERQIYQLATNAAGIIRKCEKLIEQIRTHSSSESLTDQKTCKNICMGLALTIQQKTKELRSQQRAFMEQRSHLQESTKVSFLQLAAEKVFQDDYVEEQTQKMEELELKIHEQRNSEILKIVQSIHQLNDLYKELNHLVIIQGSLLDRIDYNIDQSASNVKKGREILEKVEERQKKSKCACRMMAVMIIAVIILGTILIIRWTQ